MDSYEVRNQTCQDKLVWIREEALKKQGGNAYVVKTDFGETPIEREPFVSLTDTIQFKDCYLASWRDGFEISPELLNLASKQLSAEMLANEIDAKKKIETLKLADLELAAIKVDNAMKGR